MAGVLSRSQTSAFEAIACSCELAQRQKEPGIEALDVNHRKEAVNAANWPESGDEDEAPRAIYIVWAVV